MRSGQRCDGEGDPIDNGVVVDTVYGNDLV